MTPANLSDWPWLKRGCCANDDDDDDDDDACEFTVREELIVVLFIFSSYDICRL